MESLSVTTNQMKNNTKHEHREQLRKAGRSHSTYTYIHSEKQFAGLTGLYELLILYSFVFLVRFASVEVVEFDWVIFPEVVQSILEIIDSFDLHNVFW